MHPDEIVLDLPQVRRLFARQFPVWSDARLSA